MKTSFRVISLSIMRRLSTFCFFVSVIIFFFYIIGNFQLFLDDTQLMLLALLSYISVAGAIISLYGLIFSFALMKKHTGMVFWGNIVRFSTLFVIDSCLLIFAFIIRILSQAY